MKKLAQKVIEAENSGDHQLIEADAQNFCRETGQLKFEIERYFMILAERLHRIKNGNMYQIAGFDSFYEYLDEIKLSQSAASRLISIYETFVIRYGIESNDVVKSGGWTAVAEVLPVIKSKSDAIKWLGKVENLRRADLRRELTELKRDVRMDQCEHSDTYTITVCRCCGDKWQTEKQSKK